MSDTPETDAAVNASGGDWSPVLRAVAQRLERERDDALIDRANGDIATMTINHYERILRERDEANDELHKQLVRYDELFAEAEKIRIERDEARKERDQLKEALLIMENLLKPGIELFPEIGEILKQGGAK